MESKIGKLRKERKTDEKEIEVPHDATARTKLNTQFFGLRQGACLCDDQVLNFRLFACLLAKCT